MEMRDCPKWHGCNAPICPLDLEMLERAHQNGERVCLYLREYAKPGGTAIGAAPKPDFKLYGLFSNNGFPDFKGNASLLLVAVYILTLPMLILILSRFYSLHVTIRVHIRTYFKDIILIIVLPAVCFYVSYSILKFNHGFGKYSIPFFIILTTTFQ